MRKSVVLILLVLASCSAGEASQGQCAPRRPGWAAPEDVILHHVVVNYVSRPTMQTVRWNGHEISRAQLVEYLRIGRTMFPVPITVLDPGDDPDCAALEAVRHDIEAAGACQLGGCAEGPRPLNN